MDAWNPICPGCGGVHFGFAVAGLDGPEIGPDAAGRAFTCHRCRAFTEVPAVRNWAMEGFPGIRRQT